MRLVTTTADIAEYFADRSVAAPVASMRETGFRHLDLSMYSVIYPGSPWTAKGDGWKKEIEAAARAASDGGMDFCQAHSPAGSLFGTEEEREALVLVTKRAIEACAMLGIPHTVIHAHSVPGGGKEAFDAANADFFRLFADDCDKHGVDLLVENSADAWNPAYYLRTGEEMRAFVESAGLPRLHICWDVGHANVQGQNQYDDVIVMGDELRALHVQDNYGSEDSHVMPLVGTTNFDDLLRGLIDSGYGGDFTFESCSTLRRSGVWPNYRRNVKEGDLLRDPPLFLQLRQLGLMYDLGKWMLESYSIKAE